jgi:hypothetical protein
MRRGGRSERQAEGRWAARGARAGSVAGAGGWLVLAAGPRARGLLYRLWQATRASSPEMRLGGGGGCAGRVRRRRGARGDARRADYDFHAPTGPWGPSDASPQRCLDGIHTCCIQSWCVKRGAPAFNEREDVICASRQELTDGKCCS